MSPSLSLWGVLLSLRPKTIRFFVDSCIKANGLVTRKLTADYLRQLRHQIQGG
jgi:hypothetical protein